MIIYCAGCNKDVDARLTYGTEIYPNRGDLAELPFWVCDACSNYVGCHHKTLHPTQPLGIIPTKELRDARSRIHSVLDNIWHKGYMKRGQAYAYVSHRLGYTYHNGSIRTIEEARKIYQIVGTLHNEIVDMKQLTSKEAKES